MFYSAKTLHQSKIDYRKLREEILQGRKLVRAIAYVVQKPDVDQSGFLEALRRSGYEIKKKELTLREDGSPKGDWKMGIAMDAIALASRLDTIVLVSGDGDFVPLVEALQARGCRTELVSFQQSTSKDLAGTCDQFIPIEAQVLFKEEKFVQQQTQEYYDSEIDEGLPRTYPSRYDPDS